MKVIILAGGKGERLGSITNSIPKPMVHIQGKPLVAYCIDLFKKYGLKDIIFTLWYLPNVMKRYFGQGEKFGITCSYIIERPEQPLGTAGAIALLKNEINSTFIVCSGDILRNCDINKILKAHEKNKGIATVCVYNNTRLHPKSYIKFDKDNKIKKFVERPNTLPAGKIWSNASFYVFEPKVFAYFPKNKLVDFGKDIFPALLEHKEDVFAYKETGYFLDVGTKAKLDEAEMDIRRGKLYAIAQ